MKKLIFALSVSSFTMAVLMAQEKVDEATSARMRSEELEHSKIMHTLHMLTDRYGPRVTGTPNHEAAAKWAVAEMTSWGMKNGHLEPWDFGRAGWLNESATGQIAAPVRENLKFEVLAWTPSTKGTVNASAMEIVLPQGPPAPATEDAAGGRGGRGGGRGGAPARLGPTKEEMDQWLAATRDKVRGKIVLVGKAAVIPVNFDPPAKRRSDEQVKAQYDGTGGGRGGRGGARGGRGGGTPDPNRLTAVQVGEQVDAMLISGGALLRINDAARGEGIIVAQAHRAYDITKTVPTVILRNDDYGRIERLLEDGDEVKLAFNIVNHTYPEGKTSYNTIAEIPGTDKAEEVVMLGGHLDSWHGGTGATDNAIGCSIMMEAARLLEALDLKP
ncbi:MAG TPA: M28 family peptidase, partial [Bryobacteraceae bacterium]|nr:M28 family peptidase [Bryobacteraceae bacterium]